MVPDFSGRLVAACALMLCLCSCGNLIPRAETEIDPANLPKGAFKLDEDHASVIWKIDHLGFSAFVGRFNKIEASLDFDPNEVEKSKLRAVIDTGSIDSGVAALDEILRGPEWFDVENAPEIEFVSSAISVVDDKQGRVDGSLLLNGVRRPLTLDVTFIGSGNDFLRAGAQILGFSARATLLRSDFGMSYLVPAVGDKIDIEIEVEFIEAAGG